MFLVSLVYNPGANVGIKVENCKHYNIFSATSTYFFFFWGAHYKAGRSPAATNDKLQVCICRPRHYALRAVFVGMVGRRCRLLTKWEFSARKRAFKKLEFRSQEVK